MFSNPSFVSVLPFGDRKSERIHGPLDSVTYNFIRTFAVFVHLRFDDVLLYRTVDADVVVQVHRVSVVVLLGDVAQHEVGNFVIFYFFGFACIFTQFLFIRG